MAYLLVGLLAAAGLAAVVWVNVVVRRMRRRMTPLERFEQDEEVRRELQIW